MFRSIFRAPLVAGVLLLLAGQSAAQSGAGSGPFAAPERAVAALRAELFALLRASGGPPDARSVLVVSRDRGDTLFALNPDLPLIPASNVKLYTTAAALFYLGPRFRYSTLLFADGELKDGILYGDLVLVGMGDPSLSARPLGTGPSALHAFADTLRARGIHEVRGRVVGDDTFFDNSWTGAAWEADDRLAWYAAPVDALTVEESMVTLHVRPGGAPDRPARIETEPATEGLRIQNRVGTVARGPDRVRVMYDDGALIVTGQVRAAGGGVQQRVPVADPGQYAAAALLGLLRQRGVAVSGGASTMAAPEPFPTQPNPAAPLPSRAARQLVAVHLSPPLAEMVRITNHRSHNLFAEALFKTVGRVAAGEGSFAGGRRAVHRMLHEMGTDTATVQLADGSGLSRPNRTTTRATVRLLDWLAESDVWEPFFASLPVAGSPAGLRRMYGTAAAGNLRAKTGTIRGVSALSGYVTTADGEQLLFSIMANGLGSTAHAKQTENAVAAALAGFRRGS